MKENLFGDLNNIKQNKRKLEKKRKNEQKKYINYVIFIKTKIIIYFVKFFENFSKVKVKTTLNSFNSTLEIKL